MGRDHELCARIERVADHRKKPQLALRRQGSLGLIEKEESPRHEPLRKEVQEGLAMGTRVRVLSVPGVHGPDRGLMWALREATRKV